MSTQQPNRACLVSVDPSTADILRRQTLVVLEANHYYFEEILEFGPEAQHALSVIYRDAFAVLDAIGWRRPEPPPAAVDVPLTPGFVEQLRQRRYDLMRFNLDQASSTSGSLSSQTLTRISAGRRAIRGLDKLISACTTVTGVS